MAKLEKTLLRPGESSTLELKLDATKGEGEIKKFVTLFYKDPRPRELKLPMTGTINPVWSMTVKSLMLDFGKIDGRVPVKKRVTVNVRKGFPVSSLVVRSQPENGCLKFKQTAFKNEDGSHGWHVDFELSAAKLPRGKFEGFVQFETDFAPFKYRAFRIAAQVKSLTRVTPSRMKLPPLQAGKTWTGKLVVEKLAGDGLVFVSATCADPAVKLEQRVGKPGHRFEIKVTVNAAAGRREIRSEIVILVDEPGSTYFRVPIYGRIEP